MISETAYYPFGRPRYQQATDGKGSFYTYTGKELDQTGLFYYEARYMDPVIGRFISVDPLFVEVGSLDKDLTQRLIFDPQEGNLYSYSGNNPIIFTDPTGQKKSLESFVLKAAGYTLMATGGVTSVAAAAGTPFTFGGSSIGIPVGVKMMAAGTLIVASGNIVESQSNTDSSSNVQSYSGVESDSQEKNGNIYYHYTNKTGFEKIMSSGVIKANRKGKVYVTPWKVSANEAQNTLFAGNPMYKGKGDYVIEMRINCDVPLVPGTQPNELIHFGSMREGRQMQILNAGPNNITDE